MADDKKKRKNHKIICVVGMAGAGKTEVSQELARKGFSFLRFGQITLDKMREEGLEVNEANEKKTRESFRKKYGMAAFAILNIPKIDNLLKKGGVVVDNLSSWSEYKVLKDKYEDSIFVLAVFAPPKLRYQRLGKRRLDKKDFNRRFRPLSKKEAQTRDYAEIENIEKGGPIAMADFVIQNIGSMTNLKKDINKILLEVKK